MPKHHAKHHRDTPDSSAPPTFYCSRLHILLLPATVMVLFIGGLLSLFYAEISAHAPLLIDVLSAYAPFFLGAVFVAFMVRALVLSRAPAKEVRAPCAEKEPAAHHAHMARAHREEKSPLQEALDSPFMQAGVLLLIFSDVATTLCELMLSEVCPAPPHGSHAAHGLEHWEERLAWTGRGMLGVLMLHQLLLLWAYGWNFWHHALHVLDFVICCTAVGLEVLELRGESAQHKGGEDSKDEAFLMVMLAMRVVKVLHGFSVHAYETIELSRQKGELHEKMAALHGTHQEHLQLLNELKAMAERNELDALKAKLATGIQHEEEVDAAEQAEEQQKAHGGHSGGAHGGHSGSGANGGNSGGAHGGHASAEAALRLRKPNLSPSD